MTRNLSAIKRARVGAMMAMASEVALYAAFPDAHDPKPPGWTGPFSN